MRWAVLLKGVNVGGHRRVPMPVLKEVLGRLGGDPATYLQSGNGVLTWDGDDPAALERAVHDALLAELDVDTAVMVRTGPQLSQVVERLPFAGEPDPKLLHVGFLSAVPDPALVAAVDPERIAPDRLVVDGDVAYLDFARSVHDAPLTRRPPRLGVDMTARNWRTVLALRDLTAG